MLDIRRQDGVALIVALMALLLLTALGVALTLVTSLETMIAGNVREHQEAFYAADAAVERAIDDLASSADWNAVLGGFAQSPFIDGAPRGLRVLADGSTIDLAQLVNLATCRKASTCSVNEMDLVTVDRPWGANNPRWQLYAYGSLRDLLPSDTTIDSSYYVIVLVGDDPAERDDDPMKDSADPSNPGSGVLTLRAEALGPRRVRATIEATVARSQVSRLKLLSWHQ